EFVRPVQRDAQRVFEPLAGLGGGEHVSPAGGVVGGGDVDVDVGAIGAAAVATGRVVVGDSFHAVIEVFRLDGGAGDLCQTEPGELAFDDGGGGEGLIGDGICIGEEGIAAAPAVAARAVGGAPPVVGRAERSAVPARAQQQAGALALRFQPVWTVVDGRR